MKPEDNVALVNFFGMTLFKSCELRANDARISENTSECMSHKNYIEMIASVGADYRNSRAQTSIFHADTGGGPSDMSINNTGYVKRKKLIAGSKECEFVSPTGLDVFTTPKYLPPRSKLGFTFHRNSAKFCLMSPALTTTEIAAGRTNKFSIQIVDIQLIIRKV